MAGSRVINLLIYAEVSDSVEVEALRSRFKTGLEVFGRIKDYPPEQYWKIPEYFGFNFRIHPSPNALQCFDRMVETFKPGTVVCEPRAFLLEAIWSPSSDVEFLDPRVKWAHFEVRVIA